LIPNKGQGKMSPEGAAGYKLWVFRVAREPLIHF